MLCIQEDLPDVKYMSGKNKYGQFLAVTKQPALYKIYIQEATQECGLNLKKFIVTAKRPVLLPMLEIKKLMWDLKSIGDLTDSNILI